MPAVLATPSMIEEGEWTELTNRAWHRLEHHPHFRGRLSGLCIEQQGGTLCLSGRLPSFYLKQLIQETLRHLPGVERIRNAIDVVSSVGVSSEPLT